MIVEGNAHQIEYFAFKPSRANPNGNHGIDIGLVSGNARAKTNLLFLGNRRKVILQFKARLDRVAVNASRIGKQIELQRVPAFLGCRTNQGMGYYDGGFAVKFDHFFNSF